MSRGVGVLPRGARALRLVAAVALLAGCSAASAAAPGRTWTVEIEDFLYRPAALKVSPGDKVVWRNHDLVPHTATAGGAFDTGSIAPGAQGSWVAKRRGTFHYTCTFHPTMKATLTVQ